MYFQAKEVHARLRAGAYECRPGVRRLKSRCQASFSRGGITLSLRGEALNHGSGTKSHSITSWPQSSHTLLPSFLSTAQSQPGVSSDPQVFCQASPPYIHAASQPLRTHLMLSPLVAAHTCPDFSLHSPCPSQPPRHGSWLARLRCRKRQDHP